MCFSMPYKINNYNQLVKQSDRLEALNYLPILNRLLSSLSMNFTGQKKNLDTIKGFFQW